MCSDYKRGYRMCDQIKYIRERSKHNGIYHPTYIDIKEIVESTDCTIMTALYALEATNGDYTLAKILVNEAIEHSLGGTYENS